MLDAQNAVAAPGRHPPRGLSAARLAGAGDFAGIRARCRAHDRPRDARGRAQRRPRSAAAAGRRRACRLLSLLVDGEPARADSRTRRSSIALAGRPAHDRDRHRDRAAQEHQADGALRIRRHPLHAVRGRGLPADHALPRPARRAQPLPGEDDRRQGALSGAALERRSGRRRASCRTAGIGRNGTIPFPSPAISSRWSRAISRPIATASPPRSGRKVELGIWVREADLPRTEHAMASLKAAMAWDEASLWPRI